MQTSDFIALLALVVSFISIWIQNKGVHKQLLVSNISEYTKRYQEIFEKLPKIVLDENFNLNSLSDDDKEKLLRSMWLYFDLCYEEYTLYHELNLIDKKLWKIWQAAMKSAFSRPAFYQCWNFVFDKSFYPKPFSKFVNDEMIELHNPGRRI
ncbi:hypothetical protein VB713_11790 [Anabaena cylindrica UHCC 0172]|uniref:hypothetical protein n=1 Tax=Anabaena cylindrica TaxID=1165 RepID=UPI002B209C09|nr:hypothetical protein [Anabaena cylindrica]MEA5551652.1 hypothetical protein [Anabaena cylindrica UHCC 0172]